MKKNLLLAGLLTTFSLVAKSQVGINTSNPQGIFNIDGLKNNPTTGVPTAVQATDDLVVTPNGNLGLGLIAPGTTLDVNGAITNRETALAVAGNAVTIPANVSQVQLTGAATATVTITAPVPPNAGQRIIVYNNTTGGFGAALGGVTIPNGKALEYVYSNSGWRSTDGGSVGATPVNLYTADGTLTGNRTVTQGANTLTFTGTQINAFSVDGSTLSVDAANDRVGLGTTTPDTKLTISTPDNSFGVNHTNGIVNLKTFIGGGVASLGTTTANDLRFITNNTQKMTVTSGGNVGVGTVTPTNKLVVTGANAQPSALGTASTNATFRVDGNTNHALDFGTYTNSPFGSYISSQNKTSTTGLPLVLNPVGGNVGVGTNAPDNSALLDLTATNRGFLLPRVSLTSMTDGTTVPSPAKGLMVYNSNTALTPYGEGLYVNSGTSGAPSWDKLSPQKSDFILSAVVFAAASAPVDQAATGNPPAPAVIDNINIGLSTTVTVPPNSTAKILMTYNVPMGTYPAGATSGNTNVAGYFGIRFLKDGVEAPEGSRKYAIPYANSGSHMMSVTGNFTETVVNNGSSPLNIVYTLNGYMENTETAVRFNMWASSGDNFNWGKGSLTGTVFAKPN
ncbi:hypothetical protein EU348_04715 [Chryseobacterium indologenes]|uniref:C1q domain-containing protein n=1 Tax=Chryseobacterium indologenes TaxID=253 RepID=A0A411DJI3_CHRID|nr:hypothetical protein EU348_04715 [Chryseobacterium indologenes]